jgi:hypothetical protein
MLTLSGIVRRVQELPGPLDKLSGKRGPSRTVVQIEGEDSRGLVALYTLTVPRDLGTEYERKEGERISVPVRAWAPGSSVNLAYEPAA